MPFDYEKKGDVAYFTIRNGSVNPMTPSMHKQLYELLHDFQADQDIRVGIMTGAGERAFSAGDDIRNSYAVFDSKREELMAHMTPRHRVQQGEPDTFAWSRDVLTMERYKPIIGAVKGYCLGQGLIYLLMLTDIRIASEDATFGFPEIAYGMGGAGGSTRVVNKVVAKDQVMAEAEAVAAKIARHPPLAIRVEMEAYYRGMDSDKLGALNYTKQLYRMQRLGIGTEKVEEAFLYKRKED
jgi:enoyl-CoA hydratase/carnithine racemase